MSSVDQDGLADWLASRSAHSDARNVTLEAYAEEREARALSGDGECARHPGFRDLLASAEMMIQIITLMLANPKTTADQAEYLNGLQSQMADVCKDIFAQVIANQVPVASGGARHSAKR